MAQKLRDDKIGQLTHNAGNITMAASMASPAYLTIGGQQYKITSNLVVALPAMSANTRYQVYAILNAGVVELRISQNENSVGPAGFSRWKLVGSLYANGALSIGFGSFVNIEGVPESLDSWDFVPTGLWTSNVGYSGKIRRHGMLARVEMRVICSAAPSPGGAFYFNNPANMLFDVSKRVATSITANQAGAGFIHDPGTTVYDIIDSITGTTQVFPQLLNKALAGSFVQTPGGGGSDVTTTQPINFNASDELALFFDFPIQGWLVTPIKDL